MRGQAELSALSEEQWRSLTPVGTMRVEAIEFSRGTAGISLQGQRELDSLAARLKSFPQYYLIVIGQTRSEGDQEANRQLAQARASAVVDCLVKAGISKNRIQDRTEVGAGTQTVSFVLGQLPY